ncbi:hypothetical protein HZB01_01605 [Candidatus Woesearchaeota archaeon]|nr:hypothetical protein [Candidatus Woesearchaeota archaeon]
MGKRKTMEQAANILTQSLRHRIGSIVNDHEVYASKYAKDAEILLSEAKKMLEKYHWNADDAQLFKKMVERKLKQELTEKTFLAERKFEIMDEEIEKMLKECQIFASS